MWKDNIRKTMHKGVTLIWLDFDCHNSFRHYQLFESLLEYVFLKSNGLACSSNAKASLRAIEPWGLDSSMQPNAVCSIQGKI